MALVDVLVPNVGESVTEGMIQKWHKSSGDAVEVDDLLLELETDKATVEVVAEAAGKIEVVEKEGAEVKVGQVIAKIDTEAKGASPSKETKPGVELASQNTAESQAVDSAPAASSPTDMPLSPAANRLIREHGLDPSQIAASGKGGRLTKGDILTYMEGGKGQAQQAAVKQAPQPLKIAQPQPDNGDRQERRQPMSMLRRKIAERLVSAQQNAALLTTFNEVDMSAVMGLRAQYKETFKEKYGVSLGFMGFFVKASCEALKMFPAINGWVEGKEIVYHDYYDVGVAVSSDKGLVVPVLRDVDQMDLAQIESSIGGLARKARDGKIAMEDLAGGNFTISNGGVFGSLISTPIVNPPQSAILGMHKIQERPMAVNGKVEIRPMMYLALTYDHRIVDGKEAVQFLVAIKQFIEDPTRLLLGV